MYKKLKKLKLLAGNEGRVLQLVVPCVLLFLTACSESGNVISKFKTANGTELEQCVGVSGKVDYSAFKPDPQSQTPIWIIEARLQTQEGKLGVIQYKFNEKTSIKELSYAQLDGDDKMSLLIFGIKIKGFCGFRI